MTTKKLEDKIIKLDPLAERLDSVGMTGGAGKISKPKKLSKEAKTELRQATKDSLKYSKSVTIAGRRGDFGTPKMSRAVAKELKTAAKEQKLTNDRGSLSILSGFGKIKITKDKVKNRDEARKFLKRKRIGYKKEADYFRTRGSSTGGLISGKPKLATKGWK